MSSKEELRGGLSALFGEQPTPKAEEAQGATYSEESDIINSVSDEALREALKIKRMEGRGRPRKNTDKNGKRTDGYSRTSLILNDAQVAKIKEIAFRETLTMKEIFEAALNLAIEKYEAKHGVVKPHPESYKGDVNKVFH